MKKFLFVSLFFIAFFIGFSSNSNAYTSIQDPELDFEEFKMVLNRLELTNISGDTNIENMRSTFNRWVRVMIASGVDLNLSNIVFFRTSNATTLWWTLNNGTVGSFPYLFISSNSNGTGNFNNTTASNSYLAYFNNFVYNSSGDITGVNTSSNTHYSISISNLFQVTTNSSIIGINGGSGTVSIDDDDIYLKYALSFFKPSSVVYVRNTQYGSKSYFLDNILDLGRTAPTVTPTPTEQPSITPTSTPTGGGGSVDLTETNSLISQVRDKIPSSGDIQKATVSGAIEYWGSSGDMSGDTQIDEVSGDIASIIDSVSGDLANNEIFQTLESFESGFINLLSERNPLNLDLIISWGDITTYDGTGYQPLISSGEINFSKMCRDNEVLGDVQSTVRVLFNFSFGLSLIIYTYNLILSTLGIDNPYLYDNPETIHEDLVYDINTNTTTSYYHSRYPNSYVRSITNVIRRKGRR